MDASQRLVVDEAEPLLEAVAMADAALISLWEKAPAPSNATKKVKETADAFWLQLASRCDISDELVSVDLWVRLENLPNHCLLEATRSRLRIRQMWADLCEFTFTTDLVHVLSTLRI